MGKHNWGNYFLAAYKVGHGPGLEVGRGVLGSGVGGRSILEACKRLRAAPCFAPRASSNTWRPRARRRRCQLASRS